MKNTPAIKAAGKDSGLKLVVERSSAWRRSGAFTLIELLVVIAIIGILAAILLPVLQAAKIRAQTATCINNQKQLALACVMYMNDNHDVFPGNNWPDEQSWLTTTHQYQNWIW